jgi:hypothetical protein
MNDTDYIWDQNTDESRFTVGYDEEGKPYPVEKIRQPMPLMICIQQSGITEFYGSVMKGKG